MNYSEQPHKNIDTRDENKEVMPVAKNTLKRVNHKMFKKRLLDGAMATPIITHPTEIPDRKVIIKDFRITTDGSKQDLLTHKLKSNTVTIVREAQAVYFATGNTVKFEIEIGGASILGSAGVMGSRVPIGRIANNDIEFYGTDQGSAQEISGLIILDEYPEEYLEILNKFFEE